MQRPLPWLPLSPRLQLSRRSCRLKRCHPPQRCRFLCQRLWLLLRNRSPQRRHPLKLKRHRFQNLQRGRPKLPSRRPSQRPMRPRRRLCPNRCHRRNPSTNLNGSNRQWRQCRRCPRLHLPCLARPVRRCGRRVSPAAQPSLLLPQLLPHRVARPRNPHPWRSVRPLALRCPTRHPPPAVPIRVPRQARPWLVPPGLRRHLRAMRQWRPRLIPGLPFRAAPSLLSGALSQSRPARARRRNR